MENNRSTKDVNLKKLKRVVILRLFLALIILSSMFFLTVGTFLYWEAWIYLVLLFIPMGLVVRYFPHHDPELLERRMKMKERVTAQKLIVKFGSIIFLAAYLLPGFDKRFGWSNVPIILVVIADLFVLSGYLLIIRVFQENRYASRIIEVAQNQKVISTGPYAIIRHPMYSGVISMYVFSPFALGSYWAN